MKKKEPVEVITRFKAQEILDCHHNDFYIKYFKELKPYIIKGKDKRYNYYPLHKVMDIKRRIDAENNYVIVD